jgi:formate dehydrogenase assembly factor FdhD
VAVAVAASLDDLTQERSMTDPLLCTRCGSDELIPRARVAERGDGNGRYDLQVEVQRRPNAVLFKRPERADLTARVCGACGYTELYVDAPRALYTAHLQADAGPAVSAMEELERTREALAESQVRLGELEEKLAFVEQLLERDRPPTALPRGP